MNSEFVVDQSMHLADRAEKESNGILRDSIIRVFELIFSRQPTTDELEASMEVADNRGLEIVCRALINSNEFAFLP